MEEHLRFAVVYWHTFRGTGSDPFGPATMHAAVGGRHRLRRERPAAGRAWRSSSSRSSASRSTASTTATSPPKARRSRETNKNLDAVVKVLKEEQQRTGIKLLWGTANLFSNPRYMHGAATSCNADVFAYAARPGEEGLEVTKELGGENYVFWGGREGYSEPVQHRHEARARPPRQVLPHGRRLREEDRLHRPVLIEPKPKEPTKHQYDSDAAACLNFLRAYGLADALQAQHRDQPRHARRPHDDARAGVRRHARAARARSTPTRGDLLLGWDTDQFPTDIYLTTQCMLVHPRAGRARHRAA